MPESRPHSTSPPRPAHRWPAILLIVALLVACGGASNTPASDPAVSGGAPTAANTATAAPAAVAATVPVAATPLGGTSTAATARTATVGASGSPTGSPARAIAPSASAPTGPLQPQILKVPARQGQPELVQERTLNLPVGFQVGVFRGGLGNARLMTWSPKGALIVSEQGSRGRVTILTDTDGDGIADGRTVFAEGLNNPHGLAFHDGYLYIAGTTQVVRYRWQGGAAAQGGAETIIDSIPSGGHSTRTIVFGQDNKLYLAVGSSCNVCKETSPLRAAIWQYNADGSGGRLFARGLRNAVGLAWQPGTTNLYASNNGRDGLGDNVPPETINRVGDGNDYGWPYCINGTIADPDFGNLGNCAGVTKPVVEMQAHSAPLGLTFASGGMFPVGYSGDLFVAFHGSWNRSQKTGYKIVRARFANGQPTGQVEDFMTGWLSTSDGASWGRPVDVSVGPDGALYVSDDALGVIYRVTYAGR